MPQLSGDPVHSRLFGVASRSAMARTRPRLPLQSFVIAATALIGAVTLSAQSSVDSAVSLVQTAKRYRQLEQAIAASQGIDTGSIRVYRWQAPLEPMYHWYVRRFSAKRDIALDSAALQAEVHALEPGQRTQVLYHLVFHSFDDQCVDSTSTAPAATCKSWKRGKDKRRALNGRLPDQPDSWLSLATFTWFTRTEKGDLIRWQADLADAGLSKSWQQWTPLTQLTLEKQVLKPSTP